MSVQNVSSVKPQSPAKKVAKVLVKTTLLAGAITAGLVIGSKHDVFNKASEAITKNLSNEKGQDIVKKIAKKLTEAGETVNTKVTSGVDAIKSKATPVIDKVKKETTPVIDKIKTTFQELKENIKKHIK